jgi:hypothetical protein
MSAFLMTARPSGSDLPMVTPSEMMARLKPKPFHLHAPMAP